MLLPDAPLLPLLLVFLLWLRERCRRRLALCLLRLLLLLTFCRAGLATLHRMPALPPTSLPSLSALLLGVPCLLARLTLSPPTLGCRTLLVVGPLDAVLSPEPGRLEAPPAVIAAMRSRIRRRCSAASPC